MTTRAPLRLLCSFAHPDDEQFGTGGALAGLAARGVEMFLLTLTPGDAGEISDPALATRETLAAVRREELRRACAILGLHPPEVLDYRDGHLAEVDPREIIGQVVRRIRALRPQVVLTFDPNGGYGHPDHMAIHARTVAAFHAAGDADQFPELGPPYRPQKLYYTAFPRSAMAEMQAALRQTGLAMDFGDVQTLPAEQLGTPDEQITTVIDVRDVFEQRWAALLAHATQYGPESPLRRVPRERLRDWMAYDRFVRGWPAGTPDEPTETDLFEGVVPEA